MRAKDIIHALFSYADKKQNAFSIANAYVHAWEADFFTVARSGHVAEIEVKVSPSDFRMDFKKPKHKLFQEVFSKAKAGSRKTCPHYFYFCSPPGVITHDEIPPYAGLMYISYNAYNEVVFDVIKRAPALHDDKGEINTLLFSKFYHRYRNLLKINQDLIAEIERFSQGAHLDKLWGNPDLSPLLKPQKENTEEIELVKEAFGYEWGKMYLVEKISEDHNQVYCSGKLEPPCSVEFFQCDHSAPWEVNVYYNNTGYHKTYQNVDVVPSPEEAEKIMRYTISTLFESNPEGPTLPPAYLNQQSA